MGTDTVQTDGNAGAEVIEDQLVFLGRLILVILSKSVQREKGARQNKEEGCELFHKESFYKQGKYTEYFFKYNKKVNRICQKRVK